MSREQQCMEPLAQSAVDARKGPGGSSLSYVSQHYVRRRLCEVFGAYGFDSETTRMELVSGPTRVQETRTRRDGGTYEIDRWVVVYQATVRLTVRDANGQMVAFKDGSAAGVGEDSQIGWATHLAVTEAETDALKRAAMQLGDSFGLALYDKSQANVESTIEQALRLVSEGRIDEARGLWRHLSPPERDRLTAAVKSAQPAEAAE